MEVHQEKTVPGRAHSLVPKLSMVAGAFGTKHENRVVINVGGVKYETYKSTLKNIPDTRLSWLTETTAHNADFDPMTKEYFFDRHPGVFNMILNYYRTGKLHAPIDVCGPLFEEELAFWGIDEKQIEPCCWMTYRTHRDAQETLADFDGKDGQDSDEEEEENVAQRFGLTELRPPEQTCWERWQPRIWSKLEEPQSSRGAKVYAGISLIFVVVSITALCMETCLRFRDVKKSNMTNSDKNWSWSVGQIKTYTKPHYIFDIVEYTCIAFFTLEFIARLIFSPNKLQFFKGILNWIDLLSIIPFFIQRIWLLANSNAETLTAFQLLKTTRLIRIFRIFKLTRHISGLKILSHTIKASAGELVLLFLFLLICVLIYACLVYYAESINERHINDFKNIPIGFWWAMVTMTTLGYGDMYPRTELGYVIGSFCAITGVLVLALPVPVIVNNFALYYGHAQAMEKLPKKRKKILVGAADMLKTQIALPGGSLSEDGRSFSPNPSEKSTSSDRKDSSDSVAGSMDSGIKVGSSSASSESTGISVIFTDEVSESPACVRRVKSPIHNKVAPAKSDFHRANGFLPQSLSRRTSSDTRRLSLRPSGVPPPRRQSLRPQHMGDSNI